MNGRWLRVFGVPRIDAASLGLFRALLGGAILLIVLMHPLQAVPLELQRAYSPLAAMDWVRAVSASQAGTTAVHVVAAASAAAFALGWFARLSFVVLVAALFVRTLLILLQAGAHDWGTPLITLLALTVVPWNDAPPLAAWLRRRRGGTPAVEARPAPGRAYGFAVWLPGLTLGLAFAAAAFEKLRRSGLAWITDGAVRYHFVEDAGNAPFTIGMWVATQPELAVLLSLAGIVVEAAFIAVIFCRSWRARAIAGLAGAGLMAGFYVFQGIRWWPWWMLFAAFLPWSRDDAHAAPPRGRDLTVVHVAVVVALAAGQAWASYQRTEIEPLLSHYPMYSTTYDSPEYFERQQTRTRFEENGRDITDRVEAAGGAVPVLGALDAPGDVGDANTEIGRALIAFRDRYASLYGEAPASIDAIRWSRPFDWEHGHFKPDVRERIGSIALPR
jgi:hypothetical protein